MKLAIPAMCCFLIVCGLLLIPDGDLAGVEVSSGFSSSSSVSWLALICQEQEGVFDILALILLILLDCLYAMFRTTTMSGGR